MTNGSNKGLAAKIMFLTGFLMIVGGVLVWLRLLPTGDLMRPYLTGALLAAGTADLVIGTFFAKGSN